MGPWHTVKLKMEMYEIMWDHVDLSFAASGWAPQHLFICTLIIMIIINQSYLITTHTRIAILSLQEAGFRSLRTRRRNHRVTVIFLDSAWQFSVRMRHPRQAWQKAFCKIPGLYYNNLPATIMLQYQSWCGLKGKWARYMRCHVQVVITRSLKFEIRVYIC